MNQMIYPHFYSNDHPTISLSCDFQVMVLKVPVSKMENEQAGIVTFATNMSSKVKKSQMYISFVSNLRNNVCITYNFVNSGNYIFSFSRGFFFINFTQTIQILCIPFHT